MNKENNLEKETKKKPLCGDPEKYCIDGLCGFYQSKIWGIKPNQTFCYLFDNSQPNIKKCNYSKSKE